MSILPDWEVVRHLAAEVLRLLCREALAALWRRIMARSEQAAPPGTPACMTTDEAARHFGVRQWQVQRVFQRGLLSDVRRLAGRRVIFEADLPALRAALVKAGYLKAG